MIEHKYSTFWPRFCAGFVDGVILMPISLGCNYVLQHSESAGLRVLVFVVNSSLYLVYSIWMLGTRGQTLGKMACKIIVLDVSEKPLTIKQAVLRDILGVVLLPFSLAIEIPRILQGVKIYEPNNITTIDWIIMYSSGMWLLIELITMLTNDKRRALHDFIAGSVVVRKPAAAS
jgi:uncharacterized RDD family membrane protein YckC